MLRRSKSVPGIFPISDLHHLTTFLADPGRHLSFFLCRVESLQQPDLSSAQRDHQLLPAGEIRHLLQLIRPAAILSDRLASTQISQSYDRPELSVDFTNGPETRHFGWTKRSHLSHCKTYALQRSPRFHDPRKIAVPG